jgi:hypothetical protein
MSWSVSSKLADVVAFGEMGVGDAPLHRTVRLKHEQDAIEYDHGHAGRDTKSLRYGHGREDGGDSLRPRSGQST